MKGIIRKTTVTALALAAFAVSQGRVLAEQQFSFEYDMPIQAKCVVEETGCENSPGPQITVGGEILLGGLKAQLIFQNNLKGTHKAVEYITNVALVLPGGSITIPKQPALGGVGGNPWIYIQFCDPDGTAKGEEILLGRCVQGLVVSQDLLLKTLANTFIAASQCSNKGGPFITFGGDLTLSGLNAKLIFRNNQKGTHTAEATAEVALIAKGTPLVIPKQPVRGGAGGNPLIWVQFLHGNNIPIGDPQFLGRCNQL